MTSTNKHILIRPYKETDRVDLLDIFKRNTPDHFDVDEESDFNTYLNQNPQTYFTLLNENRIAGGIGYLKSGNQGQLTWLLFHPEYQGLGLGSLAVKHCMDLLAEDHRLDKVIITTSQRTYQFFERFGFWLIRREKDYWSKGLDLCLMEKSL